MKKYIELIGLLNEYKKTEFWKYISADYFFKIKDQKDIFVSILGKENIDNSIIIYDGKDDLLSQLDITFYEYKNSPDSYNRLNCFKLSLDNSDKLLTKEDKEILKKNKIKSNSVVLRFEAGKLPRLINEQEAVFLIEQVNKIIKISEYYREKKLNNPSDKVIDKMYNFDVKDKVSHTKINFPKLTYKVEKCNKLDQDLLKNILIFKQKGTYEIGFFYSPVYVKEDNEYAYMIIIRDHEFGNLIDIKLISLNKRLNLQNELLSIFKKHNIYPLNLLFNGTDVLYLCKDLIKDLKINFGVNPNNQNLFDIWLNMYKK